MKEYNIKDFAVLVITHQHVLEDMIDNVDKTCDIPLSVLYTAMEANNAGVDLLKELSEAHATKFTILPIVDTEVKTDGIEQ